MITVDFSRLGIKPDSKILDIGCGEGRHTARAWEFSGIFCVGADRCYKDLMVSKNKLQVHEEFCRSCVESEDSGQSRQNSQSSGNRSEKKDIRKKLQDNNSEWALSAADITSLPFDDNSFDIVICSEVIEHIQDEQKALTELYRILKPEGRLALTVPRYWPEKICWKLSSEYSNTEGGHIRIYKKKELLEKIAPLGFSFQGYHYAHSLHTPFWWLKCLTGLEKQSVPVKLYHSLLVWDIMEKPFITGFVEKLLNPVIGKSMALYFIKNRY